MIFKRDLTTTLKSFSKFPVVVVLGPRQSGKTTLTREVFKKHLYVNLEDPDTLAFIISDPKKFLREHENKHGIIIDEFQHAPQFLSYVQLEADEKDRPGYFVLTGSQNFLMNAAITQSLAGRAGILELLPLSIHELMANDILPKSTDLLILHGGYPRIHTQKLLPRELFPSYIRTYVERDVRQLINVGNLRSFQKFMKLCAGRVGQQLNVADLATNCGISQQTAGQWLSVLEASYIIFLLKPHHNNYNKRITKTPKLYFYDTGLACSLLGIRSTKELSNSTFRGHLFECLIIADLCKQFYNLGLEPSLYFWRDQNGRIEVDCIIDLGTVLFPVEIKSGETIDPSYFDALSQWNEIAQNDPTLSYIVYGGDLIQRRSKGNVITIATAAKLINQLEKK